VAEISREHFRNDEELDLNSKLLQRSVKVRVAELIEKGRTSAPLVVELDLTTACNLVCPDCISIDVLNKGAFSAERLSKLTGEISSSGVRAVILIGGGEPLAHPSASQVIDDLAEKGIQVGVTTNGTLIDRHFHSLAKNTAWVRVSVDAATPETFQYFRPSANRVSKFNSIIKQMKNLSEVKSGRLGYSFLILTDFDENGAARRSNMSEILDAGILAKEIGCDYFEVKPSYDFSHFLMEQPEELREHAKTQIEQLMAIQDNQFRVLIPTTLFHVLNNEPLVQPKHYTSCEISELRTLVTPLGVYVCPYFRGRSEKKIGDVRHQSFNEMWSDRQRTEVMESVNPSKDCSFHCIRHQSNISIQNANFDNFEDTMEDRDFFI